MKQLSVPVTALVLAVAGSASAQTPTTNPMPDGSHDMAVEGALPLENGLEELNGIDFDKGCYVGQEVTTRMKSRNLVRKRLLPVAIDGTPPVPGTPVMWGAAQAGEIRAAADDGGGLALLRLDQMAAAREGGGALTAGDAVIRPLKPGWEGG